MGSAIPDPVSVNGSVATARLVGDQHAHRPRGSALDSFDVQGADAVAPWPLRDARRANDHGEGLLVRHGAASIGTPGAACRLPA
jgi:hypothetical protein